MMYEIIGYVAALLTFSTFYMKTMTTLRCFGISSNLAFIVYGYAISAYPVMILHILLLPLNTLRLYQVIKLGRDVKKFKSSEFSMKWLLPYAEKNHFLKGDVVFNIGDFSDKLYFLYKGTILISELNKVVNEGEIFGEIGIFSQSKERTFTVTCQTNVVLFEISEEKLFRLYYQTPSVGFYLTKIIVNRMLENMRKIDLDSTIGGDSQK
jgi:CRP/FNR family transcriptional regulator, cyclic AMP receptor protein